MKYMLFVAMSLLVLSGLMPGCNTKEMPEPSSSYSQYFPGWGSMRLEDPKNAVLVTDESLSCTGTADVNPLHFLYKNVTYDLNLDTEQPQNLPSAGSVTGWYYDGTVSEPGTSFSVRVKIGKYNDGHKEYYQMEFSSGYSQVFNSERYVKVL